MAVNIVEHALLGRGAVSTEPVKIRIKEITTMYSLWRVFSFGMVLALGVVLGAGVVSLSAQDSLSKKRYVETQRRTVTVQPRPRTPESDGDSPTVEGEKVTAEFVNADGSRTTNQYTAKFDGNDYPLTGSQMADTVTLKRIDARTTERTDKKGGTVAQTLTLEPAPRGTGDDDCHDEGQERPGSGRKQCRSVRQAIKTDACERFGTLPNPRRSL